MTVYVVHAKTYLCKGSFSRTGAEKKVAEQIEAVCKTVRDSEIQENKLPDEIKITMYFPDLTKSKKTLTFFKQKSLRMALRGVIAVQIEVGDLKTKYYIHSLSVDE